MKQIVLSSIALLLLAAVNTVAQDVRYDFDWEAHFKEFKTYRWIEIKDSPKIGELREEEIKDAVDAQLAKKHLTKSNSDTADLYIAYQVAVDAGRQIASYNTAWRYGPGWNYGGLYGSWYGGWYGFFHTSDGPNPTIYPGQLALDMYDSKNQHLVWRGVVSNTIDPAAPPTVQKRTLHKTATKLLKKYPPPPLEAFSF